MVLLKFLFAVIITSYVVLYPVDGSGTCFLISFGDSGSSKSTVVVVVVYLNKSTYLKWKFQIISVKKEKKLTENFIYHDNKETA